MKKLMDLMFAELTELIMMDLRMKKMLKIFVVMMIHKKNLSDMLNT
jgi:hypothetical protein